MSTNTYEFTYSVEDVNTSIRKTNTLLRAANAMRLSIRDIKDLFDKPNFSKFMWTLVQISRTYNALRRLQRLVIAEMNVGVSLTGLMQRITEPPLLEPSPMEVPVFDFNALSVRVDAFRENLPMGLNGIDLMDLPENSKIMLQALLEDDAQVTVENAQALLHGRILHPEESTGFLESSIHWQNQVDGIRIIADAPYAWWVERGHRTRGRGYFPGHWYLTDAVELARQRLPERIRYELNQLIFQEP